MKIRKAKKEDSEQLSELSHQLYLSQINTCKIDFKLKKNFNEIQKKYFKEEIVKESNRIFVAEEQEVVVAYIFGRMFENPPVFVEQKNGKIEAFFVNDQFRGKGIGKKLFAELMAWFKSEGINTLEIEVARCNIGAKRMYLSLGFEPSTFELLTLKI